MINCSLGDDGVLSYEDTCSLTCNTGYELCGSDTRICQSDGNWSSSNGVCIEGIYYSYMHDLKRMIVCNSYSLIKIFVCLKIMSLTNALPN